MITTNKNDFIAYFQIINQLNAKSVLDIGMFLKSAGCVSRQACGLEIPGHVILDGIDLFPSIHIPVYEQIYNHIFPDENIPKRRYDLAILLNLWNHVPTERTIQLWLKALTCSTCILGNLEETLYFTKQGIPLNYQLIESGSTKYTLIKNQL